MEDLCTSRRSSGPGISLCIMQSSLLINRVLPSSLTPSPTTVHLPTHLSLDGTLTTSLRWRGVTMACVILENGGTAETVPVCTTAMGLFVEDARQEHH